MSEFKPISLEDLDLSKDDMEKIAAGARVFLAPEEADDEILMAEEDPRLGPDPELEEPPELEEAPSDLVTRRNLRE